MPAVSRRLLEGMPDETEEEVSRREGMSGEE